MPFLEQKEKRKWNMLKVISLYIIIKGVFDNHLIKKACILFIM
jgi:hypothetical protein